MDPRSTLTVTRKADGTLDVEVSEASIAGEAWSMWDSPLIVASDRTFPPRACGSCELWECNAGPRHAVWVRRWGPYVLWLHPDIGVYSFAIDDYERALGGSCAAIPLLDREEASKRVESKQWPLPDDAAWIAEIASLCAWPTEEIERIEPVTPPASPVMLEGGRWFGRDGARWCAYLPDAFALPVWLTGPLIESLAVQLLHHE